MANIFDLAKRDFKRFVTSGGYNIDIEMKTPDKSLTINIQGFTVKHHLSFDSDGNQVNTKIARITVDEDVLVQNGFTVRNAKGEVALTGYKVKFKDSSGVDKGYSVRESFPDENFGLIMLILNDAKL
ncbi:MAG: Flavobacterium phage [Bacteroidota bacterium]|jgi:hypothetical protein